jgi:hypothetical protein
LYLFNTLRILPTFKSFATRPTKSTLESFFKSALILLVIGIGLYIIDSGISSANRAKNLITNHASKINKEGGKLKAEVSARIDGVQKAFKEIDRVVQLTCNH